MTKAEYAHISYSIYRKSHLPLSSL